MKKLGTFVLLAVLSAGYALPLYAKAPKKTHNKYQGIDARSRKAQKKEQKAMDKAARKEQKRQKKMLETQRKKTTFKPKPF